MSQKEFKAPRPVAEIQREYANLCMRVGDLYYKTVSEGEDLKVLCAQLKDLNFEAMASQRATVEAKAKADAEAKAQETAPVAPVPTETPAAAEVQVNG